MFPNRKFAAPAAALIALSLTLTACGSKGSDDAGTSATEAFKHVTIEGDAGKEPEVKFDGKLETDDFEVKVLEEGDGETIEEGDTVSAHYWIGNGFTQKKSESTYEAAPAQIEVGADLIKPLKEAMLGQKVGARVAVLSTGTEAFGEGGSPQLGIGNQDTVLFIVDIMGEVEVLDGPEGEPRDPAKWAPKIIEKDGEPTGFDFTTGHKPQGTLIGTTVIKGDGPVVEKGQTIKVNYLGQVYKGKQPFDESYTKEPASFAIGVGQVVAGWDEELVGRTVGSRLILEIPPNKGYGKEGNESAGIKGTDTLFFVVDILSAG